MFTEMFRFKGELTIESVKEGVKLMTGEEDFLGFSDEENEQDYLDSLVRSGFVAFDKATDEVVIYVDGN